MTNGRGAEPPQPAENKEYQSQAGPYWRRRGDLAPNAGLRQPIRGQREVPQRHGSRGDSVLDQNPEDFRIPVPPSSDGTIIERELWRGRTTAAIGMGEGTEPTRNVLITVLFFTLLDLIEFEVRKRNRRAL